jgi:hypothetical protein
MDNTKFQNLAGLLAGRIVMLIEDIQSNLGKVYPNKNHDINAILNRIFVRASEIGSQALRRNMDQNSVNDAVVHCIAWNCALATKLRLDYKQALYSRFPGKCPYCMHLNCKCAKTNKLPYDSSNRLMDAQDLEREITYARTGM